MKIRVNFKYFVNDSFWKHFFASNSSRTPLKRNHLNILVTLRPLTQSRIKIGAINLQKK